MAGFLSYKITEDGLFLDNILVFHNFRGLKLGNVLIDYAEKYAKQNGCKQIYLGARRSANKFYFKFEGSCLIQSSVATKEDLENLMKKHSISNYSYNLYEGCNPPVYQIRIDAIHMNNTNLVNEIDNSNLDIGCILTFSKKVDCIKEK